MRWQASPAAALLLAGIAAGPAAALQFAYESTARFGGTDAETVLTLRGEIEPDDPARLKAFLVSQPDRWLAHGATVVPVIDGGDVEAAKQIGALLRDALSVVRLPDAGSSRCVSACFFMLAQAVERHAVAGTVGVHRPYFDRQALAAAAPEAARRRYADLLAGLRADLIAWAVPQSLVERMFATPSADVHWLSVEELAHFGEFQPWFAEYAQARCDLDAQADDALREMRALGDEAGIAALRRSQQSAHDCIADLRRRQRAWVLNRTDSRAW